MAVTSELPPPAKWQKVCALLVGIFVLLYVASCLLTNGYGQQAVIERSQLRLLELIQSRVAARHDGPPQRVSRLAF
jgi:hypothetical protein